MTTSRTSRPRWAISAFAALLGPLATASYLSAAVPAAAESQVAVRVQRPGAEGPTAAASFGLIGGGIVVALPAGIAALLSLTVAPAWGWVALIVGPVVGAVALLAACLTANRYLDRERQIFGGVVGIGVEPVRRSAAADRPLSKGTQTTLLGGHRGRRVTCRVAGG